MYPNNSENPFEQFISSNPFERLLKTHLYLNWQTTPIDPETIINQSNESFNLELKKLSLAIDNSLKIKNKKEFIRLNKQYQMMLLEV